MDWTNIINSALNDSGLQDWVSGMIAENKDNVDNIEEYVTGIVINMINGNGKKAYKDFSNLKTPTSKLAAARWLIGRARKRRRDYDEFKKSVATVLGVVIGSAAKGLL